MSMHLVVDPEQDQPTPPETEEVEVKAEAPVEETPAPEDDIPEKFKGKSMKELVDAYKNLETELGRKNNEVGTIRKLADELIGIRAAQRAAEDNPPRREPVTTDQLLSDPENAILGVVKATADEKTSALEKKVQTLEEQLLTDAFEKKHPGFQTTMTSPEFGDWLRKSPVRQKLGFRAAQGDFEAADDLFTLYEESKAAAPPQPTPAPSSTGARQATTVRSGGSAAGGVVPSTDGKKVWSRSELMEMRIRNPEKFDMMQPEILQAYAEKRVR